MGNSNGLMDPAMRVASKIVILMDTGITCRQMDRNMLGSGLTIKCMVKVSSPSPTAESTAAYTKKTKRAGMGYSNGQTDAVTRVTGKTESSTERASIRTGKGQQGKVSGQMDIE